MTSIFFISLALLLVGASAIYSVLAYRRDVGTFRPPEKLRDVAISFQTTQTTITATHLATSLGGAVTISFIGLIYRDGTFYIAAGIAFIFGLMVYRSILPVVYREFHRKNLSTFEDYLSGENRLLKSLVSAVNLFIFFMLAAAQFSAALLLFEWSAVPYPKGLLFALVLLSSTYVLYGVRGVFLTEKLQLAAVVIWLFVLMFFVFMNFDITSVGTLPLDYISGMSKGPIVLLGAIFLFPLTAIARADLWQRSFSSGSAEQAQKAISILMVVMLFVYALMGFVGVTLASISPDLVDYNNAAYEVLSGLSHFVLVLALVGILSALVSTADSSLNLSVVSILNILNCVKERGEDDNISILHAVSLLGCAISAFFLATSTLQLGDIVLLASTAAALLLPTFIATVLSKNALPYSKILSVIFGIVASIVFFLLVGDAAIAFVPGTLLGGLFLVVGSKVEPSFFEEESKTKVGE